MVHNHTRLKPALRCRFSALSSIDLPSRWRRSDRLAPQWGIARQPTCPKTSVREHSTRQSRVVMASSILLPTQLGVSTNLLATGATQWLLVYEGLVGRNVNCRRSLSTVVTRARVQRAVPFPNQGIHPMARIPDRTVGRRCNLCTQAPAPFSPCRSLAQYQGRAARVRAVTKFDTSLLQSRAKSSQPVHSALDHGVGTRERDAYEVFHIRPKRDARDDCQSFRGVQTLDKLSAG